VAEAISPVPAQPADSPSSTEAPSPLAVVSAHSLPAKPTASDADADAVLARRPAAPACESYGTAVEFLSRPAEAARQALREDKLLFVLHVSGNFEDAKFT
jgi:hypothetical protein